MSSMLKKKSAFKPKVLARRTAPATEVPKAPVSDIETPTTVVNPWGSAAASSAFARVLPGREAVQAATPPAEDFNPAQVQQSIEAAGEPESTFAPIPKRGRKRKADVAATIVASSKRTKKAKKTSNGQARPDEQVAAKTKRPRKKRTLRRAVEAGGDENDEEGIGTRDERPVKKRKRGRQRSATPEEAENVKVDITQVKMADLAKDLRIGKKFSRHDELANRERSRRQTYKLKARAKKGGSAAAAAAATVEAALSGAASSNANDPSASDTNGANGPGDASGRTKPRAGGQQSSMAAPQFQIIDGQIVLDTRSLQVDRHARAAQQAGELEEEVEDEFSRRVTSATYLRRSLKPNQWSEEETALFYTALASFGTDFDTISRMFPGKERRHVKLKFNREERECPNRINAALIGEKTQPMMGIDEYGALTGLRYEDTDTIYAEQRQAEKEFEARQKKREEEEAEEKRKKREALYGGGVGDENAEGGLEGVGASGAKASKPTSKRVSKKAKALAQARAMAGPEICVGDL
ncbi:hypothetical protein P8C59_008642 [Phyllachora maydis]|uniref:Myb-like domain-containing protein n=1 Tax=Phyllachora maydis TaxID=1825666 RepID=A0AAD9IC69_9PEZI|nr:hypothetical protein P8C59_008642 [Phyllachora maydis]